MRCWPGAVCRIDRVTSGPKSNVGAFVTVLRTVPLDVTPGFVGWEFVDASRPLVIRNVEDGSYNRRIRASVDIPDCYVWLRDANLTPITPPPGTVIDEVAESAPVLESANV